MRFNNDIEVNDIRYNQLEKGKYFNFSNTTPIIGENVQQAIESEYPFIVSLVRLSSNYYKPERNYICGGALISPKNVLTAQHCLEEERQIGVVILIGSVNLRQTTRYYIFWWKTYYDWCESRSHPLQFVVNDIAVIRLISEVPETLVPGLITNVSNAIFHGLDAEIVGWGITNNGKHPKIMKKATVNIITIETCEAIIERLHGAKLVVDTRFLCSLANPYILMNKGDSGAPVIHMGKIIGINRSTIPLPGMHFHPEKVNIHIGIYFYRGFLIDMIAHV